jgi:hypothetical protein
MAAKLRLVKVVVQPHFVLDDGETLTEQVAEAVTVPASDWPTYATKQFRESVELLEESLNRSPADDASATRESD